MTHRRNTYIALGALAIVLAANYFLFEHRLLYFGTGSSEPALLNSTWLMSVKEIERANKTELQPVNLDYLKDPQDPFWRTVTVRTDRRTRIYRQYATTHYFFLDGRLFAYILQLKDYRLRQLDSLVLSDPHNHFVPSSETKQTFDTTSSFYAWSTGNEKFTYGARQYRIAQGALQVVYTKHTDTWQVTRTKLHYTVYGEPALIYDLDSLDRWYGNTR